MKKKYIPYTFDEQYEYNVYDSIGKKCEEEFTYRKKRGGKEFRDFDKYLEWEEYFSQKYSKGYYHDCNFIHYLIRKQRMYQQGKELSKVLMIPICIAMVTVMTTINLNQNDSIEFLFLSFLIGMFASVIPCLTFYIKHQKKEDFYNDCIEVMNKLIVSHQK